MNKRQRNIAVSGKSGKRRTMAAYYSTAQQRETLAKVAAACARLQTSTPDPRAPSSRGCCECATLSPFAQCEMQRYARRTSHTTASREAVVCKKIQQLHREKPTQSTTAMCVPQVCRVCENRNWPVLQSACWRSRSGMRPVDPCKACRRSRLCTGSRVRGRAWLGRGE